jgi:hypothetical protein
MMQYGSQLSSSLLHVTVPCQLSSRLKSQKLNPGAPEFEAGLVK